MAVVLDHTIIPVRDQQEAVTFYTTILGLQDGGMVGPFSVVRANLEIAAHPLEPDRQIFTGTLDQIQGDIEGCRRIGAHEIILDPTFSSGTQRLDRWLESMEQLRNIA